MEGQSQYSSLVLPPVRLGVVVNVVFGDLGNGPAAGRPFDAKLVFAHLQQEVAHTVGSPEGTPTVGDDPCFDSLAVSSLAVGPPDDLDDMVDVGVTLSLVKDTLGVVEAPSPDGSCGNTARDRTSCVNLRLHGIDSENLTVFFDTPNGVVGDNSAVEATLAGSAVAAAVVRSTLCTPAVGGVLEASGVGNAILINELICTACTTSTAPIGHTVNNILCTASLCQVCATLSAVPSAFVRDRKSVV